MSWWSQSPQSRSRSRLKVPGFPFPLVPIPPPSCPVVTAWDNDQGWDGYFYVSTWLDWGMPSNRQDIILGVCLCVSVRAFLEKISIWICRLVKGILFPNAREHHPMQRTWIEAKAEDGQIVSLLEHPPSGLRYQCLWTWAKWYHWLSCFSRTHQPS